MKTKKYTIDELIEQARREEREACAVVADGVLEVMIQWSGAAKATCEYIAAAIRARGDDERRI